MPDFKAHIDTLYQAVHAADENDRIKAARKLYQDLIGAPPLSAEDRIETLKALNQQLQDEVNAAHKKADAEAETKWKAQNTELKRNLERAEAQIAALTGDDSAASARARLHTRLRRRLNGVRETLANLEELEGA